MILKPVDWEHEECVGMLLIRYPQTLSSQEAFMMIGLVVDEKEKIYLRTEPEISSVKLKGVYNTNTDRKYTMCTIIFITGH